MFRKAILGLTTLLLLSVNLPLIAKDTPWITGYLPSYYQTEEGELIVPINQNDFRKLTHISHHGPYVNRDGSLNYAPTKYSDVKALKMVEIAHANRVPVLLCVVSWKEYRFAVENETTRTALAHNILRLLDTMGYDGVDVDLEPVIAPQIPEFAQKNPNYVAFVRQLYDSLQTRTSALLKRRPLLTTAVNGIAGPVLAQIHELFDQINLMTYDMSQPWEGWPVWHDAALSSSGYPFPDIGDLHSPSVIEDVDKCLKAGIPPAKLGIGVSADAFQWRGGAGTTTGGATEPLQQWTIAPQWNRFAYKEMMQNCFKPDYYRWDDRAKMSYLSIDREGSSEDEFWSYNDERSCFEKMDFVMKHGLGGVIIWELGSAFCADLPEARHLPQLDALYRTKMGWRGPMVYKLVVKNGTGSGEYEAGTIVKIKADPPMKGKKFKTWTGDIAFIADARSAITTIMMRNKPVTVKATYKNE